MNKQDLFSKQNLETLISSALKELRKADTYGKTNIVSVGISGGVDSTVISHLIKNNGFRNLNTIFTNKSVENSRNIKIINKISSEYENVEVAKPSRSYKAIVHDYGFPIGNKNLSFLMYRVRKVDDKNYRDVYKVICGVSPYGNSRYSSVSKLYSLPLKLWYLAKNYPIQEQCCRILKKDPLKKVDSVSSIVGIMKSDSPQRRIAIRENMTKAHNRKFFPLKDWTKKDVLLYLKLYGVEYSDSYKDRITKGGDIIIGATNTGCIGCHFGNTEHYYIPKGKIKKVKTTKFENLKREQPRLHKNIMQMKHRSGVTFEETIKIFEESNRLLWIKESIEARDWYISKVESYIFLDFQNSISTIEFSIKYVPIPFTQPLKELKALWLLSHFRNGKSYNFSKHKKKKKSKNKEKVQKSSLF